MRGTFPNQVLEQKNGAARRLAHRSAPEDALP